MNNEVRVNSLVHVVWGEEQAPIPAMVTEVISANEFRAVVMWPGHDEPVGPFRFYNADLDRLGDVA